MAKGGKPGGGGGEIRGSRKDDTIITGIEDDIIDAREGNDSVNSGAGNDSILAGDGADTVWAYAGDDTILGEGGDDSLFGLEGNDLIDGGDGNDLLAGYTGDDTLLGGLGDDTLAWGSTGNNHFDGGEGTDTARVVANRGEVSVTQIDATTVEMTNAAGETTLYTNIEFFEFIDGTMDFATLLEPITNVTASNLGVADATTTPGGSIDVSVDIGLTGSLLPTGTETTFVLSTSADMSGVIDTVTLAAPTLTDGQSATQNASFGLPADLAPGTYYVAAIADSGDAVTETDETDNQTQWIAVTVAPQIADFAVTELTLSHPQGEIYDLLNPYPLSLEVSWFNEGNDPTATDAEVIVVLSRDTTVSSDDIQIHYDLVSLANGDGYGIGTQLDLPPDLEAGTWHVIATVAPAPGAEWSDDDPTDNTLITSIEVAGGLVYGTEGNDSFTGTAGTDSVMGFGGDDLFIAVSGAGVDTFEGGECTDTLDLSQIGEGPEGTGVEVVIAYSMPNAVFARSSTDYMRGEDLVLATDVEVLIGTDQNDYFDIYANTATMSVFAGGGDDWLFGGDVALYLDGGDGNDYLYGLSEYETYGPVNDTLVGGAGNDTFHGGTGDDLMSSGSGEDVFEFMAHADQGNDTITDFDPFMDHIVIEYAALSPQPLIADAVVQTAEGALISHGTGNTILLSGVDASTLDLSNLHFVEEQLSQF